VFSTLTRPVADFEHDQAAGGSRIGARYRHTTPEMAVHIATAIEERLAVVVRVAEAILQVDDSGGRGFLGIGQVVGLVLLVGAPVP
jgi:hypothetical protein